MTRYHRIVALLDLFVTLAVFAGAALANSIQAFSLAAPLALAGCAGIALTVSSFIAGVRASRKE